MRSVGGEVVLRRRVGRAAGAGADVHFLRAAVQTRRGGGALAVGEVEVVATAGHETHVVLVVHACEVGVAEGGGDGGLGWGC